MESYCPDVEGVFKHSTSYDGVIYAITDYELVTIKFERSLPIIEHEILIDQEGFKLSNIKVVNHHVICLGPDFIYVTYPFKSKIHVFDRNEDFEFLNYYECMYLDSDINDSIDRWTIEWYDISYDSARYVLISNDTVAISNDLYEWKFKDLDYKFDYPIMKMEGCHVSVLIDKHPVFFIYKDEDDFEFHTSREFKIPSSLIVSICVHLNMIIVLTSYGTIYVINDLLEYGLEEINPHFEYSYNQISSSNGYLIFTSKLGHLGYLEMFNLHDKSVEQKLMLQINDVRNYKGEEFILLTDDLIVILTHLRNA